MVDFALSLLPNACCIVPEKREEVTTEGGLAVAGNEEKLRPLFTAIKTAGIRLSLFIEASEREIRAAAELGADIIELHTGTYCDATTAEARLSELQRIQDCARLAHELGIEVHAGHGLTTESVGLIGKIPEIKELNIGHAIISDSIFMGLRGAIELMKQKIKEARFERI